MNKLFLLLAILISMPCFGQTILGTAAQNLAAGSWTELTGTTGLNNALIYPAGTGTLPYSERATWDATHREFLYYGGVHSNPTTECGGAPDQFSDACAANERFIYYSDATNTWSYRPGVAHVQEHAYDSNAINPTTGDFWTFLPGPPGSTTYRGVYKWTRSTATWSQVTTVGKNPTDDILLEGSSNASADVYFPEMAALVRLNFAGFYQMAYLPDSGSTWISIFSNYSPHTTTIRFGGNPIMAYDPIHHIIVFGGGGSSTSGKQLYKMDSSRTITQIASFPIEARCDSQTGNFTEVDPVTGTLLLFTNTNTYTLDLGNTGAAWQTLAGVHPSFTVSQYQVVSSISSYGVIMVLERNTSTPRAWIYRHAADTFASKCAQPGVLKCVGFESSGDIPIGNTATGGCTGGMYQSMGYPFGIQYPIGCQNPYHPASTYTGVSPAIDTNYKASGSSSLKFTIPTNSVQGMGGEYFTSFTLNGHPTSITDYPSSSWQYFSQGDLYIQWKMRWSPEMFQGYTDINGHTGAVGGQLAAWKLLIVGGGDIAPCSNANATDWNSYPAGGCTPSHTYNAWVVQDYNQQQYPIIYRGSYYNIMGETGTRFGNGYQTSYQNARATPFCTTANGTGFASNGNCFMNYTNEWLTFQIHIKQGTWSTAFNGGSGPPPRPGDNGCGVLIDGCWNRRDSSIELYAAREGGAMEYVISLNHIDGWDPAYYMAPDCYNASYQTDATCHGLLTNHPDYVRQLGKVYLIPNMQHVDGTQATTPAYVWYDDLIISTNPIGVLPQPPAAPVIQ
jgi:hypothetical protein